MDLNIDKLKKKVKDGSTILLENHKINSDLTVSIYDDAIRKFTIINYFSVKYNESFKTICNTEMIYKMSQYEFLSFIYCNAYFNKSLSEVSTSVINN